jgi:hypothetical protein
MSTEPNRIHPIPPAPKTETTQAYATTPSGRPRPLRRWSVAELIARAFAAPAAAGVSHS